VTTVDATRGGWYVARARDEAEDSIRRSTKNP
jgi:hypothetical protein